MSNRIDLTPEYLNAQIEIRANEIVLEREARRIPIACKIKLTEKEYENMIEECRKELKKILLEAAPPILGVVRCLYHDVQEVDKRKNALALATALLNDLNKTIDAVKRVIEIDDFEISDDELA